MLKKSILLIILIPGLACKPGEVKYPDVMPPAAEKRPVSLTIHGDTRVDDYFWLNQREDTSVLDYLKAENDYLDTMLAHAWYMQDKLYEEMKGRIKERDNSVPIKIDNYYYYTRYLEGYDYPIYCRKHLTLDAPEEILADGNQLGKGKRFFSFFTEISPSHDIACLVMDTIGRRFYTIYFKDLVSGKMLPDHIPAVTGEIVWANDNKTIFYTRQDPETLRSDRVFRHKIGVDSEQDDIIYTEMDSTLDTWIFKSRSKKLVFITSGRTDASETRYFSADNPGNISLRLIEPVQENVEYYAEHFRDRFFIYTNLDAKNYRLAEAPENNPGKENWKDIVPHRDSILLKGNELFKNYLVVQEEKEGLARIRTIRWDDKLESSIAFAEPAYVVYLDQNPDPETDSLRYNYQSLTSPVSVFDYHMADHTRSLLKQQEILGGFRPSDYRSERYMVTARDGARIPMSIVYRADLFKRDGSNPGLIYGYGSYGSSSYPYFNSNLVSLLDRGFVYALAHVRGGQEMGGQWYEDGKMMMKKNTFTDFIDCSQFLLDSQLVDRAKLFAKGGSAGGLLMGAVTNMAPELYKGIIANVPFVDVVTTMLDESIPLTTFEWLEWGNPNIPEQYEYMLSYSPYDNVEPKDYPNILVTTGLHDSQVQYWEPAKWVAKLRAVKTDNNLLYLHTNMSAGHGGASGRFLRLKEVALEYTFILDILDLNE
ncbi:MAG TPA: S9 family peptidase [Cyclobacteriaceae bacterium]|nr:S9 family peptidase [Cyclobacteriaceae bacterium]